MQNKKLEENQDRPKKKRILARCPRCKAQTVEINQRIRKNYPFGRKSKSRKSFGKKIKRCISCGWVEQ